MCDCCSAAAERVGSSPRRLVLGRLRRIAELLPPHGAEIATQPSEERREQRTMQRTYSPEPHGEERRWGAQGEEQGGAGRLGGGRCSEADDDRAASSLARGSGGLETTGRTL